MAAKAFDPKFMKVGVLTAALQELTPREVRDPDPDKAIEEWLAFASEIGASYIQLSAALHPSESDVPAEAMLDPVMSVWDAAAVRPIVEEAGGVFTDWSGRATHDGGSAVATNSRLAEAVRRALDG